MGNPLAGLEFEETSLSGRPQLKGVAHKHFVPRSVITVSTWFHLVPAVESVCLSPLLVEGRSVTSKACLDHLLNVDYCVKKLGRKEGEEAQ